MYIYIDIYMYMNIYKERETENGGERDRDRDRDRDREVGWVVGWGSAAEALSLAGPAFASMARSARGSWSRSCILYP